MTDLLVHPHAPDATGCVLDITPASAGWQRVGFRVHRLRAGQVVRGGDTARESCLVVLTGVADVLVDGHRFSQVGGRSSVFQDTGPGAVYAPAGTRFEVSAATDVELAICSAPGESGRAPRAIGVGDMSTAVRGKGTNTRYIRNILPEEQSADSLLVVEVITPGGHWSSYPPHKHDTMAPGHETALEETYYHRINPAQGFAFQRVYTDDRDIDETLCINDGDVVLVPRGYHPVGAAHGYDLYYLNVMAGPRRNWVFRNDPAHEWLLRPREAGEP
ncbi:MAG: 5-deoxy-glucuronate isomerase [Proteobacteria bacterium]|nr:5-deoxy-glucuronate isomerase [Pseudomonadota bacterium]